MSEPKLRPAVRQRVRWVTRQMWALHVGRGLARTVVAAAAVVAAVGAVDYLVELSFPARVAVAACGVIALGLLAVRWVGGPARTWGRARVVVVLENLFPRLGQRLRTSLEYGARPAEDLARAGVAPDLVAALEEETAEKARPLPFQAALPVRPVLAAGTAAALCLAGVVAWAAHDPEWRTTLRRVALAPDPYTTISAAASADRVDEGGEVDVRASLTGRARPAVVLHAREEDEPGWREEVMTPAGDGFAARLAGLRSTTEFFVSAGPDRTPVGRVLVRRPLKLTAARIEVRPPAYTGVAPATHEAGSFSAIQGSTARFVFELDRPPAAAALLVKDPAKPGFPPRRIEMTVQGKQAVAADLPLDADIEYAVDARDEMGVAVLPNRHRVRVTADQPPSVWCEDPPEGIEVHTLAEVLLRARARDDFGVSKVGIVFQVNNEEERTLVVHDVKNPFQRAAAAEQLLLLEQFLLTEKDCVAYYAFAEDNRPGTPQRAVTDLRFIDIRPFKRVYSLFEPGEQPPGPQRELIFLDEVIARQRFNLNQTIRLETRSKVRLDAGQVDRVAAFENKLATQTHDLADFLAGTGVDGAALLTQAEETMLSAVDSLQGAKFATAIGQERDALRYLMEARNTIQMALPKTSKAVRAQARAFDRIQRQKLRRQDENKAETLAEIAAELNRLADEEDDVAHQLAAAGNGNAPKEGDPAKPTADKTAPGAADPAKPSDMGGGAADKGKPMPDKPGPAQADPAKPTDKPAAADDPAKPMPDKPGRAGDKAGAADPIQDRQDDVAARATVLDKTAATAKGLTGLAKTRIAEAAKAANAGADALGQKDRETARKEVDKARETFRIAAKQAAALAAEEAVQQLAAARDLANELAREVAPTEPAKSAAGGAGGKEGDMMPGLGAAAEQAKTLKDVLEQVAGSGSETSAEAARRAGGVLKTEDLGAAAERLQRPGAGADRTERQDLAERFAAVGQKLDQAYRELVAPRLEALAKLEREAAELERRAAAAEDDVALQRVRQQAAEFVEKLDAAKLGDLAGADLRGGLRASGPAGDGGRVASTGLTRGLVFVHERLVAKLQEFVAGDRLTTAGEAVPAEYRDLVDRYLRALSAGRGK